MSTAGGARGGVKDYRPGAIPITPTKKGSWYKLGGASLGVVAGLLVIGGPPGVLVGAGLGFVGGLLMDKRV